MCSGMVLSHDAMEAALFAGGGLAAAGDSAVRSAGSAAEAPNPAAGRNFAQSESDGLSAGSRSTAREAPSSTS